MSQSNINQNDIQHAMTKFIVSFPKYQTQIITPLRLSDGMIFVSLLCQISNFNLTVEQLQTSDKWTVKLNNLKKLVDEIQEYFQKNFDKGIRTRDIDLIEIARRNCMDELVKLFQVVMAVLMESSHKEDYIEIIMALDQRSQSAFVSIIQNAMELRSTSVEEVRKIKMTSTIDQLNSQNALLKEEILELTYSNNEYKKTVEDLNNKILYFEEEIMSQTDQIPQQNTLMDELPHQNQQLKNMVSNLKQKLLTSAVEHETQIARMKEQISILEAGNVKLNKTEELMQNYKQKYQNAMQQVNKIQGLEKDKAKLNRLIEQKDLTIKKLQQRVQAEVEKNYAMEEKQLYLKMELQKNQVRLSNGFHSEELEVSLALSEKNKEESEEYKQQLSRNQQKIKQMDKENRTLLAKAERVSTLEQHNKKLEKAIQQLDKTRTEEMQIILLALFQFRNQNSRLMEELKKNQRNIKFK